VQIIGQKKIDQAARKHADWRASLRSGTAIVKGADWTCDNDIQQTFNTADPVGRYVVFNIAGNKARLVSIVDFTDKSVIVKEIKNHQEYDRTEYR
jgi:mRNA interferase HigB